MKKLEFSKKLLMADYILFILLCICAIVFTSVDFTVVITAWIAQIGVSSTAYYSKAKSENKTKIPMKIMETLPEAIRKELDLTQIITTILQGE